MIVGLVSNSWREETREESKKIAENMRARGLQVIEEWQEGNGTPDLLVVLGGDGTILGTARRCGHLNIPILTVNMGRVGFLAELEIDELDSYLERIIKGDYGLESRMMLQIRVRRDGRGIFDSDALNEVSVLRQGVARMSRLKLLVDNMPLADYIADGVICATPTGSTAYSLSAGGPVVMADTQVILVTPVCPYTPALKPLVLDADKTITIIPDTQQVTLTVDGQDTMELHAGDEVVIQRSPRSISLVRLKKHNVFEVLSKKLYLTEAPAKH